MIKTNVARLITRINGWTLVGEAPPELDRCVFVFAPHTSNWDFFHGVSCMLSMGAPVKVVIKKFWMRFPFGLLVRPLGGVGIERSRNPDGTKRNQVEMLATLFRQYDKIALIITPEGSRSARKQWKTGFYYIARSAGVPIVTLTGDYSNRTVKFGPVFSGDESLDTVMRSMMKFFRNGVAVNPENFVLDERYTDPSGDQDQ